MQFPIQDHYIPTNRHRKATIRSKWTFSVAPRMYVMILNGKLDNKFQTEYFARKRERKFHNVQFMGESNGFSTTKIVAPARESYIRSSLHMADCCQCLSRIILNILYDRHGPNPGFVILRTFEHLNSNT